jgi:hypothetical protein
MEMVRGGVGRLALGLLLGAGATVSACGGDEGNPESGAPPQTQEVPASCEARVADSSAPLSVVSGTGSVTEDRWTVAMASVLSGYANKVPQLALKLDNEELRIVLSTAANACGRVRNGIVTSGQPQLLIEMASHPGTKIEARSYKSIRLTVDGVPEGVPPGACSYGPWPAGGGASNPRGTLEITAIDSKHVAGTYRGAPPEAGGADAAVPTVTIAFDVPFCGSQVRKAPLTCCVP